MDKTGLAFSGGGIRSAAFCSGVLRRLLQKNANIDYVSCVSGGGYTGSAYVEWKYRNGKKDDKRWHQEFFNHMRQETGIVCHWQKPCQAILEFMAILALFVFVCVIVPVQLWASFAYPVAFIVDFFFGNILRGAKLSCHQEMQSNPNITLAQCREERRSLEAIDRRSALFLTPIFVGFTSNVLKHCIPKARVIFKCLSISCVIFFFLVFFPWFINQFLQSVPTWLKIIASVPLFFLWISFPLNRPLATLMIGIYFLSFVVFWRVYKEDAFGIAYEEQRFNVFLGIAMLIHLINPLTVTIQQRLVHVYVRWFIQKAFFYPKTVGKCGCAGITWRNLFLYCPISCCDQPQVRGTRSSQALTLEDLGEITPTYIGCTTSNQWKRTPSKREAHYEVLTMSSQSIERLDRPQSEQELKGKLMPMDMYLSEVAATSASAVNHHAGSMQGDAQPFKDLKILLGLSAGTSIVADERHEQKRPCCVQILPMVIELLRGIPLIVFFVVYFKTGNGIYLSVSLLVCIFFALLLTFLATIPTGSKHRGRLERIARWFTINFYAVTYLRNAMQITDQGPNPPAVLYLSDGGHIENLGILPLLKKTLKKIVSVDGGRTILDGDYGKSLLRALDLAREKLHCSFLGINGEDVAEDIREKFVERSPGSQPSSYRFKVQYYEKNFSSDGKTMVGEGEILYIAPRHPSKAVKTQEYVTWADVLSDTDVELPADQWGNGPKLTTEEADRLTFGCCECCHGNACRGLSEAMCGAFPQHSTNNQFFTPTMFSAYHREGYRASMEAKVEEFLNEESDSSQSAAFIV